MTIIGLIKDLVDHLIMENHVILGGIMRSFMIKVGIIQIMIKDMLINMIMENHIILGGIITIVIQVGIRHFMMKVGMILH